MNKYIDKQVQLFRYCAEANCTECAVAGCPGPQKFLKQAADVIEELRKKVNEWQEEACKWNNEYYYLFDNMPCWIPMTERPPEEELAFYQCYTDAGLVVQCLWTNNRTGLGPLGEWGWRFTDVPPHQKITHWMPLPKPPKEE